MDVVVLLLVYTATPAEPPAPVTCASSDSPPACSVGSTAGELCTTTVQTLRPTQASLGMLLVGCKTAHFNGKSSKKQAAYLQGQ